MSSGTILTIGSDAALQYTRGLILEQAGYTVLKARNEEECLRLIADSGPSTLVLVCHSVPRASTVSLATAIRQVFPRMPILQLARETEPPIRGVDAVIYRPDITPLALLSMVGTLAPSAHQQGL